MSFESEFKLESSNAIKATQEVTRVTAISLFTGIIKSSPVGNTSLWKTQYPPSGYVGGNFRSSWFMSTGTPSSETTDSTREQAARLREVVAIATDAYSSSYWLTNNLPYGTAIEGGHSKQAPTGVIAPQQALVNKKIARFQKVADKKYGVA